MLVLDWMRTDVTLLTPEDTLLHCSKIFKETELTNLPVIEGKDRKVVGMVTLTVVRSLTPHATVSSDIVEALETMERTKVREFMIKNPDTINYKSTVPRAARLMVDKHVRFLPVVDEENRFEGFLTEWDVFQAMATISGGGMPAGVELVCEIENRKGALREIVGRIRDFGVSVTTVQSIITKDGKMREVLITFWSEDAAAESRALDSLNGDPGLRFWNHHGVVYLRDPPPNP